MIPGRGPRGRTLHVLLVGLSVLLGAACRKEAPPAPWNAEAARRGRSLFQRGMSARDTPLVGLLGPERIELSGSVAACARCHTPSGRGSQEGGVDVPDIRPEALRHPRPRASVDVEDRSRPAYGRDTLLRAITEGLSASGRPWGRRCRATCSGPPSARSCSPTWRSWARHPTPASPPPPSRWARRCPSGGGWARPDRTWPRCCGPPSRR
ncbi:hypothetical protein ACN28S_65540 [Cystobacter fuscus]